MQDIHNLLSMHLGKKFETKEVRIQDITKLKSGWAGDIFSFNVGTNLQTPKKLILKIYSGTKSGVTSIEKECQALACLKKIGYSVPQLFSYDVSMKEFDKPFLIMERIEGKSLWEEYTQGDNIKQVQCIRQFTKLLFELHSIEVKVIQPDFEGSQLITLIDHELEEITQIMHQYKLREFQDILQWLESEKRSIGNRKPCILHRDYHPWNVLVEESIEFYVIDWVWGIGDYRFDLAWTVTLMERSGFEQFADQVYKEYVTLLDGPIKDFNYFKVLATLRWILNVTGSIQSGENLREGEVENFRSFINPLLNKATSMMQDITNISVEFQL